MAQGLVRGALQGYTGFMQASEMMDEQDRRKRADERAQTEFGLRKRALEQQLAAGDAAAAKQARLDAIDQEIAGTPAAELAGPEAPGMDRTQSGLSVPAKAGLQGPSLYEAYGRKALLNNDFQGYSAAKSMGQTESRRAAMTQFGSEYDQAVANGTADALIGQFNKASGIPAFISKQDPKTGMYALTLQDGARVDLTPIEKKQLYIATRMYAVDPEGAMNTLSSMNDKMRAVAMQMNTLLQQQVQTNNQGTYQAGQLDIGRRQAGAAETSAAAALRNASASEQRAQNDIDNGRMAQIQYFQDKEGKISARIPTMVKGKLEWQEVAVPEGMRPYKPSTEIGLKVNQDGSVVKDGVLYVPDPKTPGKYTPAKGIEKSALDKAIEADMKGQGGQPQGGMAGPGKVEVPGRPFYNVANEDLARIAQKPRGVSSAEAAAAQEELDARKGEARMGAF